MLVVDLSNNNAEPDWDQLALVVDAVWLKASEGRTFTDPRCAAWRRAANAAGLRVGLYHYARPDVNPDGAAIEAQHFALVAGTIRRRDLRPVLDYEKRHPAGDDADWIVAFNETVRAETKTGPLFYSYPAMIQSLRLERTVGYGLWLASYGRDDGLEHPFTVPAPWKRAAAHQFTSEARLPGCTGRVDLSRVIAPNTVLAHPERPRT